MTIESLVRRHGRANNLDTLSRGSLRYRALRSLSGNQFLALTRSVIAEHSSQQDYEKAFDEMVDKLVITHANE